MPPITTPPTESPIPLPRVDTDEPVAVIPTASVAPIDGPADGERINIYTVAPKRSPRGLDDAATQALDGLRERALRKPLGTVAIAFTLGYFIARVMR